MKVSHVEVQLKSQLQKKQQIIYLHDKHFAVHDGGYWELWSEILEDESLWLAVNIHVVLRHYFLFYSLFFLC